MFPVRGISWRPAPCIMFVWFWRDSRAQYEHCPCDPEVNSLNQTHESGFSLCLEIESGSRSCPSFEARLTDIVTITVAAMVHWVLLCAVDTWSVALASTLKVDIVFINQDMMTLNNMFQVKGPIPSHSNSKWISVQVVWSQNSCPFPGPRDLPYKIFCEHSILGRKSSATFRTSKCLPCFSNWDKELKQ